MADATDLAVLLSEACDEMAALLPKIAAMSPELTKLGELMFECWARRGKVMFCGNGGSCADAMHFAEEFVVRFRKNRRALAAIAFGDGSMLTCAGNDYGYDRVFSRQVEALGNDGDLLVVLTTSGNSRNCILAVEEAKRCGLKTAAFLGRSGGALAGVCDVELIVPHDMTHVIQEAHMLLFHTLCVWIDQRVD